MRSLLDHKCLFSDFAVAFSCRHIRPRRLRSRPPLFVAADLQSLFPQRKKKIFPFLGRWSGSPRRFFNCVFPYQKDHVVVLRLPFFIFFCCRERVSAPAFWKFFFFFPERCPANLASSRLPFYLHLSESVLPFHFQFVVEFLFFPPCLYRLTCLFKRVPLPFSPSVPAAAPTCVPHECFPSPVYFGPCAQ